MDLIFSSSSTNSCYESVLVHEKGKIRFSNKRQVLSSDSYIQKLTSFKFKNGRLLWCFRRSGVLELYQVIEREDLKKYRKLYELDDHCKNDEKDFIVFLEVINDVVYCCSNKGKLRLIDMREYDVGSEGLQVHTLQLCEPISSFCVSPIDQWVVAVGGYDNHLQLYHLITPFNGPSNTQLFQILNYTAVTKLTPFWKAKVNKKHCKEFEEFPWITDIVFLSHKEEDDEINICCVTQFGKLVFYNTGVSQHSINELTISNNRIRKLVKLKTQDLLFVDSFGLIGIIRNESILYHYRIINFGPLSGLDILELGDIEPDDDGYDDDLVKLSAKRQSQKYKLRTTPLNDIFIFYTTITGSLKTIKLKQCDNGYETLLSMKLPRGGYVVPCLVCNVGKDCSKDIQRDEINELMNLKEKVALRPRKKRIRINSLI